MKVVSKKQIAANKRNAAKSTGPRTAKGKQRSRMNALQHGLSVHTAELGVVDAELSSEDLQTRNISLYERLHRIQYERARILSSVNPLTGTEKLTLMLRQASALSRYEARISAALKRLQKPCTTGVR